METSPSESIAGRHVLVVGAGSGIGRASALRLAACGAELTVAGRSSASLERTAAEIRSRGGRARVHVADVSDPGQVSGLVTSADAHAPLWGCVNSAGGNRPGPTIGYPVDDFDDLMRVHVRGTFLLFQAAGERLLDHGGGRLVAVSSQMGTVGYPGRAAYCTAKHAINGLVRALAVEWARGGVTVNAVAPTFIETPMTSTMFENSGFLEEVLARTPQGRLGDVDEVSAAIEFLLGPRSSLVNGAVLAVDGGWTAW